MTSVKPHGGKLVIRKSDGTDLSCDVAIDIDRDIVLNTEQIATGAFSPLEGFMNEMDFYSCINDIRLSNGIIWPIPIVLSVSEDKKKEIEKIKAEKAGLTYNGKLQAILEIGSIYKYDKKITARKIFNTEDINHPGVKKWMLQNDYFIGGKISQISPMEYDFPDYMLTPTQTRELFKQRGLGTVCGFQTRNIPHRGHETLQRIALKQCDGLFIQPLIGWKKKGDFKPEAIIKAYSQLINHYYPKHKVMLGTLSTAMFYAGPKEAIFHAIIRKNFGCTHFIVGRDHAGVSYNGQSYYKVDEACRIFDNIEDELGIKTIRVDTVFYFNKEKDEIVEFFDGMDSKIYQKISGTTVRDHLLNGIKMSPGLIRPEVAHVISREDLIE